MKTLFSFYKKQKLWIRFLINVFVLGMLWFLFYSTVRKIEVVANFYAQGSTQLTNVLLYWSKKLLELLGQQVDTYPTYKILRIAGTDGIRLDLGCLGRNLMALFAAFILSFPSQNKHKFWYIPLGILCICILNVFRMSYLAYVIKYSPAAYFRYNHHEIFNYVVYAFTFLMWAIWIKNYGTKKR